MSEPLKVPLGRRRALEMIPPRVGRQIVLAALPPARVRRDRRDRVGQRPVADHDLVGHRLGAGAAGERAQEQDGGAGCKGWPRIRKSAPDAW